MGVMHGLVIKATLVALYIMPSHMLKTFTKVDVCNKTILLEEGQDGGVIDFRYPPRNDIRYKCYTFFRTSSDSRLVLWFLDPRPVLSQGPSYSCETALTLWTNNKWSPPITFCRSAAVGNTKYLSDFNEIRIDIEVGVSNKMEVRYKMIIGRYMTGGCNYTDGLLCNNNRCVPKDLACGTGYDFCTDGTSFCSDIENSSENRHMNTIIGITCAVISVVILAIALFVLIGRKCGCVQNESDRSRAARAVFTTQFTSRGVTANNNDGEEPIDYSKFQDPPQYCSLENIHSADCQTQTVTTNLDGHTQTDDPEDLPPAYQEVLNNQAHYNVSFFM